MKVQFSKLQTSRTCEQNSLFFIMIKHRKEEDLPTQWLSNLKCKPIIKDCFLKNCFNQLWLWIVQKLQCTLNFPSKSYVQYSSDLQLRLHERPRFSGSFHKLRKGFSNEILMYKTSLNILRQMRFGGHCINATLCSCFCCCWKDISNCLGF